MSGPKRVLCVCAQNLVRSPTMAYVLSQQPYNYNCRSAGVDPGALVPVTQTLVNWAEEIFCAQERHAKIIRERFDITTGWGYTYDEGKKIHVLHMEDPGVYYRDVELEKIARQKLFSLLGDLRK